VNEDVFAYSNRVGRERALVVYNNRYADAHGRVRTSVGFAEKRADGSKAVIRRDLADGLALRREDGWYTVMRDAVTGLEHIRSSRELADQGLEIRLGAYGRHVFLDMREVADGPAGQYGRLAVRLGGAGVPSVEDALRELQLQPVHDAFRALAAGDLLGRIVAAASGVAGGVARGVAGAGSGGEAGAGASAGTVPEADGAADLRAEAADRLAGFLSAVGGATGVDGDPAEVAARVGDEVGAVLRLREMTGMAESGAAAAGAGAETRPAEPSASPAAARAAVGERLAAGDRRAWSALLGYLAVHRIGELAPGGDPSLTSRAWFDELRLNGALAGVFRDVGLDEGEAWRATDLARLLVRLPTVSSVAEAGALGPTGAAGPTGAPRVADAATTASRGADAAPIPATTASRGADATPELSGARSALPASARTLLATWVADDDLRRFIRVNRWEGVAWFEQEAFEELLGWAQVLDAVRAAARSGEPDTGAGRVAWDAAAAVAAALTEAAGTAGYRLDGLREVAGA
jgi:hypothetical protein